MEIAEALSLASIAHTVDSRSSHRSSDTSRTSLVSEFVVADETADALTKALNLPECPLLAVTATGRVIVLRQGKAGTVAIEGVDEPNDIQLEVLVAIGKASYEASKVSFPEFYKPPTSGARKKVAPVSLEEEPTSEDAPSDTPAETQVDNSEPGE
jgi:hypothetical protein